MSKGLNHLAGQTVMVSAALFGWRLCEQPVDANPTGGTAAQGGASFKTSGSTETITTSGNAYINWSSFNIGAGETTTFVEPAATSVVWNYVNSSSASQILGNLNANGYVILQNQSGFYVGGQAAISAHGLIMTTASSPAPNLTSSGAWEFDAPPPAAKIINYGQINIAGEGAAYLIADDIENNGTISTPSGQIGLYAGEKVLVSMSPDGRGLSAQVTLPQGSVDNNGQLIADGGSIVAQAQTVNQNGLVQANSVQEVNGTIELVASDAVNLGANSAISAQGDSTTTSSGGAVSITSEGTFSDQAGSTINVSGSTQGGNGGQIAISAPQMTSIQSTINGQAAAGYADASLSIDTDNILINSDGSASSGELALNANSLSSGFSQINLQAADDINLDTLWNVAPESGIISTISLQAGDTINVPQGTGIEADGGRITLAAPTVNQDGTLQANSIGPANGVVEIDAGENLNIGANSVISANGDPTAANGSPGGFVVLQSGGTYADTATSTINVTGQNGGANGIVEILGNGSVQSTIGGTFATLINPYDITLSDNPTAASGTTSPNFNISDLANYSQIDLHALDDIELTGGTGWNLNGTLGNQQAWLSLEAGNNILLDDGSGIYGTYDAAYNNINADNWSINLAAGTGFVPTTGQPEPPANNDSVLLYGSASVQTYTGNINIWAANQVVVGDGSYTDQAGSSGINTFGGGNISVTAEYGNVNAGSNPYGFYYLGVNGSGTIPYYLPYTYNLEYDLFLGNGGTLGGISTAAGGNVTINAGGSVYSYLPSGTGNGIQLEDGGTGAFGSEPGNVTINAGGSVYGNYVLINGVGSITAGQNVGATSGGPVALSLAAGGWTVNAPNGDIYLQEVRNPNGALNNTGQDNGGYLFDFAPDAYVDLDAYGVYLTGQGIPRASTAAPPILYAPILDITTGAGGLTLDADVTLFPSPDQNLDITTTDGGSFSGPVSSTGSIFYLFMSDSPLTQWVNAQSFSFGNIGTTFEDDNNPALINISGNMEDLGLYTSKPTELTVGGNMTDCDFSAENLNANDLTSINVAGEISNPNAYTFVNDVTIPSLPTDVLYPGYAGAAWEEALFLALNPAIATLQVPSATSGYTPSEWAYYALKQDSLFGDQIAPAGDKFTGAINGLSYLLYNTSTGQLGFGGPMSATTLSELTHPLTVLVFGANGLPETYTSGGKTYFVTTQISWVNDTLALESLYTQSQADLTPGHYSPTTTVFGYQVGGPGTFDVTADSISLGDSYGIISEGVVGEGTIPYSNLDSVTPEGATVNVTVDGNFTMQSSTIAALAGGNVSLTSLGGSLDLGLPDIPEGQSLLLGYGVYTSGIGNVNVVASGDIDINGSRIATFDGGNIFVESYNGSVDVGSAGNIFFDVPSYYVNPVTGHPDTYSEFVYGSGIVADTLNPGASLPPNPATLPGNITVLAPEGNITGGLGGITQQVLGGSLPPGRFIDLVAGTPPYLPGDGGDIDLADGGVIGGTINATGNNVSGLFISSQNSTITAAQNADVTVVAGGQGNVSGQTVSGTIVGVGGVDVTGTSSANVFSQNANVNGSSSSTLGTSATATSTSQSASQTANAEAQQQVAVNSSDNGDDSDDNKKKKPGLMQHIKRVTVLLPKPIAKNSLSSLD